MEKKKNNVKKNGKEKWTCQRSEKRREGHERKGGKGRGRQEKE